jgi:hypothetical protein
MKTVIAKWQGDINGSRYTLHETKSLQLSDVALAIDALGDPTEAIFRFVPKAHTPKVDFEEGYYEPENAIGETKLKNLWHKLDSKIHYDLTPF